MPRQIQLRVYPDGRVEAVVEGVKGKRCTDYIKVLEELLDAQVLESEYTPEYYETEEVQVDEVQRQRLGTDT